MLTLRTVPCLSDNYAFILHDGATGQTAIVDAPEAAPLLDVLKSEGWNLTEIWITHHHHDHVMGLADLQAAFPTVRVVGAKADAHRLPQLTQTVQDGQNFDFAGHEVRVMDVSGHTNGHIAYYVRDAGAVFTADSLMALGCGRLFEGTPAQMWHSLTALAALPDDTLVCSGHEYTETNARFALTIEPENSALQSRAEMIAQSRRQGLPTVPSRLGEEKETNPFLRAHLESVKSAISMPQASDIDVFAAIRARKDAF